MWYFPGVLYECEGFFLSGDLDEEYLVDAQNIFYHAWIKLNYVEINLFSARIMGQFLCGMGFYMNKFVMDTITN